MSGYLSFEGRITPMVWGDKTYTVLPLPPDIDAELRARGAKRVEGEIAEHPVNLALSTAPVVEWTFLWTGKTLLDRIGIAPAELVEVRLRPASDDAVATPEDVQASLRANDLSAEWATLSPGKRRGHLHQIETAKRPETRAKRIAALIESIRAQIPE